MGQAPSGQACRRERKEYDDAKIVDRQRLSDRMA